MIGRIQGVLISKQPPQVVLDVNGLGYEIFTPLNTFYSLPDIGGKVILHTHFIVREDAQQLYGFLDLTSRELFRALIKITGVGPKLALAILSTYSADDLVGIINQNHLAMLQKVPGVGKRTAEKLMLEIRNQFEKLNLNLSDNAAPIQSSQSDDAINALMSLGYKPNDAKRAVESVASDNESSESLIKNALKFLSQGAAV